MNQAVLCLVTAALTLGSASTVWGQDPQEFNQAEGRTADGFASEADRANYFSVYSVRIIEQTPTPHYDRSSVDQSVFLDSRLGEAANITALNAPALPSAPPAAVPPTPTATPAASNPTHPPASPTSPSITGDIGSIIGAALGPSGISAWVTIGQKIWDIIVANKPSAVVQTSRVSVLPVVQADWAKMDSWQGPMTKTYTIQAINGFGTAIASHTYTISFNFNGELNGAGHYISNATIIPSKINVGWGYALNSKVEFSDAVNTGTAASPLPGLSIQLDWSIDNVFRHAEGVENYFIKGDGSVARVNQLTQNN